MTIFHYFPMKTRIPTDKKIYIFAGAMLIVCAGLLLFFVQPYMTKISTLTTELYDARVQLASAKKQRENLVVLNQDFRSIENRISAFDSVIIPSEKSLEFVSSLEEIANASSVTQDLSLSPLTDSAEVQEVPLAITLTGTINQVIQYLSRLESSPYYVSPLSMVIFPIADEIVQMDIQTKTYWIEKVL